MYILAWTSYLWLFDLYDCFRLSMTSWISFGCSWSLWYLVAWLYRPYCTPIIHWGSTSSKGSWHAHSLPCFSHRLLILTVREIIQCHLQYGDTLFSIPTCTWNIYLKIFYWYFETKVFRYMFLNKFFPLPALLLILIFVSFITGDVSCSDHYNNVSAGFCTAGILITEFNEEVSWLLIWWWGSLIFER